MAGRQELKTGHLSISGDLTTGLWVKFRIYQIPAVVLERLKQDPDFDLCDREFSFRFPPRKNLSEILQILQGKLRSAGLVYAIPETEGERDIDPHKIIRKFILGPKDASEVNSGTRCVAA